MNEIIGDFKGRGKKEPYYSDWIKDILNDAKCIWNGSREQYRCRNL